MEEYVSVADLPTDGEVPNKFWLKSDVGIIKYEYVDPFFNTIQTYELSEFEEGR